MRVDISHKPILSRHVITIEGWRGGGTTEKHRLDMSVRLVDCTFFYFYLYFLFCPAAPPKPCTPILLFAPILYIFYFNLNTPFPTLPSLSSPPSAAPLPHTSHGSLLDDMIYFTELCFWFFSPFYLSDLVSSLHTASRFSADF